MEENNNAQENGSIFGNMNSLENEPKKDLYEGLDSDTFGKMTDTTNLQAATEKQSVEGEQETTVYTSAWNSDAYIPGGQTNNYSAETSVPEKKQGKALEICALVFGILSLCGCCYGLFGMIGLVLSIIALATGRKSGLSIAGLILSIIGIVGALAWTIFCFSSAGQEWSSTVAENFIEGFEEGYNSTYEGATTEAENSEMADTESDELNASANPSLKNETVGKVIIDGKEITFPCKFSEIENEFEISDESKKDIEGGLEAYDVETVTLASGGKTTGTSLVIWNYDDTDIADIGYAYVTGVNMDSYGETTPDVKFFNDITFGMSKEDLEKALDGMEYNKNTSSACICYSFYAGEESDYFFSIYVTEDKVNEVLSNYYGDEE